jgi:hypothetical protein
LASISLWSIANKIKWECLCWGIGTAIGELPPYFVARAGNDFPLHVFFSFHSNATL